MNNKKNNIYGLILLGGMSSRFGSPKGLYNFRGSAQWIRLEALLRRYCSKVFFSLNEHTKIYYPDIPSEQLVLDKSGAAGPMAGLFAAMSLHRAVSWLLVSVDLFFLDAKTLDVLFEGRDKDAFVSLFFYHKLQPLCAIYEPAIYPKLTAAIDAQEFGLYRLICGLENYKQLEIESFVPDIPHIYGALCGEQHGDMSGHLQGHPLKNINEKADIEHYRHDKSEREDETEYDL